MPEVTVHNVGESGGAIRDYMTYLREKREIEDYEKYRVVMGRIGFILANELSRTLPYEEFDIMTPLAPARGYRLNRPPVVVPIMRAGLAFHEPVMTVFPGAGTGIIGAFRKHDKHGGFTTLPDYATFPRMTGDRVIVTDPMLATGSSIVDAVNALVEGGGKPSEVHVISAIAAAPGVEFVKAALEKYGFSRSSIWCAAIDPELDENGYIRPGLGDAGDRLYGPKDQA